MKTAAARAESPRGAESREPRAETVADSAERPAQSPRTLEAERAWAAAYRQENNITKAAMAAKIGYSRDAYSKWEDGTYAADPEQITAAVTHLRDRIEGPSGLSSVVGFRETQTTRLIFRAYEAARQGELMILVGESGVGKTEPLREIQRRASLNGGRAPIYYEATVFTSAYALVCGLADHMGLGRDNPDAMIRDIVARLKRAPCTLILDEAHYAQEKAIEALRQIRDQSGIGVILSGTALFAGLGHGQIGRNDLLQDFLEHRPHLEQVVSRATIWEVPGLSPDEIADISRDVLGRIQADGLERLRQHAGHSIRRLVRLLLEIPRTQKRRRRAGPVEAADVDMAWHQLYLRQPTGPGRAA